MTSLETRLLELFNRLAPTLKDPLEQIRRLDLYADAVRLRLPAALQASVEPRLQQGEKLNADGDVVILTMPMRVQLRGGRTHILGAAQPTLRHDPVLIKALGAAHGMVATDARQLPLLTEAPGRPYQRRIIRLAFLAPEIQEAIFAGRQPAEPTLEWLMQRDLPDAWAEQIDLIRHADR